MRKLYDWLRRNWYTVVLPFIASFEAFLGMATDKVKGIALGAFLLAWACWIQMKKDREGGRDGGGQCHKATGNDKAGPESPEIVPKFVHEAFATPASEPKTGLALGIVTIFLRTHRVVHRRITMGYVGSADSGVGLSGAVTCWGRRALSRPISNGGSLPIATISYAGHATRRGRQSRWARSQAEFSRPFSPCQSDSVAPFWRQQLVTQHA